MLFTVYLFFTILKLFNKFFNHESKLFFVFVYSIKWDSIFIDLSRQMREWFEELRHTLVYFAEGINKRASFYC